MCFSIALSIVCYATWKACQMTKQFFGRSGPLHSAYCVPRCVPYETLNIHIFCSLNHHELGFLTSPWTVKEPKQLYIFECTSTITLPSFSRRLWDFLKDELCWPYTFCNPVIWVSDLHQTNNQPTLKSNVDCSSSSSCLACISIICSSYSEMSKDMMQSLEALFPLLILMQSSTCGIRSLTGVWSVSLWLSSAVAGLWSCEVGAVLGESWGLAWALSDEVLFSSSSSFKNSSLWEISSISSVVLWQWQWIINYNHIKSPLIRSCLCFLPPYTPFSFWGMIQEDYSISKNTILSQTELLWGIIQYKPACARCFFRNTARKINDVLGQLRELVF